MNIAIISLYLPSNSKIGVGYQVHYLANELVKRGHKVTVFSQTAPPEDSLYEGVAVASKGRFRTFGFAWNLRKYDFSRFDILNACGDDWFLWGRKRPRHIHTFMGSCFAEMLHIKGLKEKLRMALLALCEYSSCFLADDLVAISSNTRRYIPMIKNVIPCGVDLNIFYPTEEKSSVPTILFVGTMKYRKRGMMLLELFKRQIKPSVPDAELWLVCKEKVEEEGVRWFGRVSTEKLAQLYRRAWVFCLPSTYEGFGVPYIEAMASGTPVVASPNLGAREVTQDGRYGFIVADKDLERTLINLLNNAPLRKEFREKGLKRAQDFSWEKICVQYEELYKGDLS